MTDRPTAPDTFHLTRERLLSGELGEAIRRMDPKVHVLSDAERAASLAETLAARPRDAMPGGCGDVWVFAYGSLIWNPAIHVADRVPAHTPDWRRSYCLQVKMGRGTPENPGLMLGLAPGDGCTGVALKVAEELVPQELDILWRREMVASGYIPRWVPISAPESGAPLGHAIAFTINPRGPSYCDELPESELVHRLATARGQLGSSAEYLFNTHQGLAAIGIEDPFVSRLASLVAAKIQPAD